MRKGDLEMKKILISGFVLLFSSAIYAYDIVPKVSVDLPGTFRSDYDVQTSGAVGAEARYAVNDYISLGTGFEYLLQRAVSNKTSGYFSDKNFNFVPVYISVLLYPFGNFPSYRPYFKVDGGYNVAFMIDDSVDSSSGLYASATLGIELLEKYVFEMATSRYEAKDNGENITYKKVSFKAGYKFTI